MKVVTLSRGAAIAAMVAGALFIGIQFIHPSDSVVTTARWLTTGYLTMGMAVLALLGVSGLYVRQAERAGIVGFVGFALLSFFFLLTVAFTFVEVLVLPVVVYDAPGFVEGFVGLFGGSGADPSLGALAWVPGMAGALYMVGGVLFGWGVVRAGTLDRRAGWLLASGALLPLLSGVVPGSLVRMFALPVGLALVCLGRSLWAAEVRSSAVAT